MGEFTYRGEFKSRPLPGAGFEEWTEFVFFNNNPMGKQWEWWFHQSGCRRWFLVIRDRTNNLDHVSFRFKDRDRFREKPADA